jgi:diguanylate cyclase (GGDEF)-like protein
MNGKRLPCILCVDDEPQILDGLALLLQRDYRVMTAPGGKAALEKVREFGPPAVILTDMRMPGMDGAHLLKTMSLLYPETTRILLTGDPSRDAAIAAINEGKIFRFLTKPCAPDQVRAAIEAGVTHHQLMTAERAILQAALVARSAVAGRSEESPLANSLMDSVAETTSHRDRDSLNDAVARLLLEFLDAESASLHRLIDDRGITCLLPLASAVRGNADVSIDQPFEPSSLSALEEVPSWKECVQRRQAVLYRDTAGTPCAVFPVESAQDVIGILVLRGAQPLRTREVHLVGAILRILKNHIELLDYGERDTLTHMLNRKTFETRFLKLRQHIPAPPTDGDAAEMCWLGLVDIDRFKSINDSHGHLFGDEVLLLVSQFMQQCFRGADQLFRFGGEEFVIVLDRATVAEAHIAFERLRHVVESFEFPQVGRVTISLGYSQIRVSDNPTTCVERADSALYYAKQHGRNRVCYFDALVAGGELSVKATDAEVELF